MILPLLLAVAAALALPWLAQAPDYVAQQYADCVRMFRLAGDPTDLLRYPDLFGALRSLGYDVAPTIALGLRALVALLTLGVALRLTSRGPTPWPAAGLYVLAAAYVLLFNPRTEHNTYSLLGPALGLCAGFAWIGGRARRALVFVLLGVAMAQDRDLLRPLMGQQALWGKPLATLVFLVLAAREWCAARAAGTAQPGAAASTTRSA
jgi:alpha-1,2-mannosyltransferase